MLKKGIRRRSSPSTFFFTRYSSLERTTGRCHSDSQSPSITSSACYDGGEWGSRCECGGHGRWDRTRREEYKWNSKVSVTTDVHPNSPSLSLFFSCQESFNSDQRYSPSTQTDVSYSKSPHVPELDPPKCVVCMVSVSLAVFSWTTTVTGPISFSSRTCVSSRVFHWLVGISIVKIVGRSIWIRSKLVLNVICRQVPITFDGSF